MVNVPLASSVHVTLSPQVPLCVAAASAVSIRPTGSSVASITNASSMDSIRFFMYSSLSFLFCVI